MLLFLPVFCGGQTCMFLKGQGKIIGVTVPHHHSYLASLKAGCLQKGFGFLNSFPDNILITALPGNSLEKPGKVIGRNIQAGCNVGYGQFLCEMFVYIMFGLADDLMDTLLLLAEKLGDKHSGHLTGFLPVRQYQAF